MTDVGDVAADLVHAAGLGPCLDERDAVAAREHLHARQGTHAGRIHGLPGQRPLPAAELCVGVVHAREARVDIELLPLRQTLHEGEVALVDEMAAKRLRERLLAEGGLCHHGQPGGDAVEPMHGPRAGEAFLRHVEERGPGDAAARHHRHAGGFDEHGMVRAFVHERRVHSTSGSRTRSLSPPGATACRWQCAERGMQMTVTVGSVQEPERQLDLHSALPWSACHSVLGETTSWATAPPTPVPAAR